MSRIFVTGADGFVGRAICIALAAAGHDVRAGVRICPATPIAGAASILRYGDIAQVGDWRAHLENFSIVIHLAGRAHIAVDDDEAAFRAVNVHATAALACAAGDVGVERFVFASSIKVNGESTAGRPFMAGDQPAPEDIYGRSKYDAEQALREIEARLGLDVVIVRPPLVYGAGAKANFLRLVQLVDRGVPLPFGSLRNARSLIGVRNLADFFRTVAVHECAGGKTFLVSDNDDVSTPELVRRIAAALGRRARLFRCPPTLLKAGAKLLGAESAANRLLGSLCIDPHAAMTDLGWRPRFGMADELTSLARWYRAEIGSTPS